MSLSLYIVLGACQRSPQPAAHDEHEPRGEHAHGPGGEHLQHAEGESLEDLPPHVVTVHTERVLLFVEYPPLVRGTAARFLVHLTVLADGEPVRSGRLVLEADGTALRAEAPKRDGLFTPEGPFPTAGRFAAQVVVESSQLSETISLGEFVVHADAAAARAAAKAAGAEDSAEPAGAVPFLLEQQWKLKLLLAEARPQRLAQRVLVPARTLVAEGASAIVSPPTAGRLSAPLSGAWPRTGQWVEAGQILALVEPPLSAPDLAQIRALELELDRQALDVERDMAEASARLRYAERERDRLAQLRAAGLSTQQQLEQAEQDLAIARSGEAAAQGGRELLQRVLRDGRPASESRQMPIRAPIAGVVAQVEHVLGESVEPGETLFRIVDTTQLWIEGRVSEFDLPRVIEAPATQSGTAAADAVGSAGVAVSFAALPGLRLDLAALGARQISVASEVDPVSRTVAVRYELPNPDGRLRAGMLAQLELASGAVDAAVTIPAEAVVLDGGIPTAYVMLSGELFQRRELELGVRDGALVEVRAGLAPGERVVTRGAATIRMASLSPASFGAGHAH
ncbi:MAG: efflux RND transporter periplasmic adaptor subunit [Planctomycetota bacterium]